jgi:hypothetical protein
MVYGNNELQDTAFSPRRPGGAGVASYRQASSSFRVIVPSLSSPCSPDSESMFYNCLCSPSSANALMVRISTVIESSASTCALSLTQPFLLHSIPPHAHRHQHSTTDRLTRMLMPIPSPESCPPTTSTPSTTETKARQWACTRRTISVQGAKGSSSCDDERYRDDDIDGASMSNILPSSPAFR